MGIQGTLAQWARRAVPFRHRHRSIDATLAYWRAADDPANRPERYLDTTASTRLRSGLLLELVEPRVPRDAAVFELGCNVGRNLAYLHAAGYRHLSAVEINEEAVQLLGQHHSEVARDADIRVASAEEFLPTLPDDAFDLVFTMAVLEHIHTESEWVFAHLPRITRRWLVTVEDEEGRSWRHFPRDYRRVFEGLGMRQVEARRLSQDSHGLGPRFRARVFEHPDGNEP